MKIYNLKRTQFLPISRSQAWDFFSAHGNLAKITPAHMGFEILYASGDKVYAGQWVTEITHVKEPFYFVDEQRFGPYVMWHHEHHFKEVPGGVEMTDEVNYAIPLGPLGWLAHFIFVGHEVNRIFDFRFKVLEEYFKAN